jgi:CheY-like chemotaxis protein
MTEDGSISVLLVEDNADFSKLVRLYLGKFDEARFDVLWRDNGREAIEEIERNTNIDVVLMDYFLPGLNRLCVKNPSMFRLFSSL